MNRVTLRQAKDDDLEFLYAVSEKGMAQVRESLNHSMKSLEEYKENFDALKIQVIQLNGVDVGRLRIVRSEDDIYIGGIQILPEFQRKGVGTLLMQDLIKESNEQNIHITLEVHDVNTAAKNFYTKLGFKEVETKENQIVLRYDPVQS